MEKDWFSLLQMSDKYDSTCLRTLLKDAAWFVTVFLPTLPSATVLTT